MEKRNAKAKVISEIRDGNILFTEPNDIMKCCREFYKGLYSEQSIDNNMVNKFLNDVIYLDYLLTLWNIVRGSCLLRRQKRQCP